MEQIGLESQTPLPRVRVYVDEIKPAVNEMGECWMYLGLVAVPESRFDEALGILGRERARGGYDGEVHFSGLGQAAKQRVATAWLQAVLNDSTKLFHFHVLGINLSNIQRTAFGDGRSLQDQRMHTRFFRSAVAFALKSFFGDSLVISSVCHDDGDLKHHEVFEWHSLWRLQNDNSGFRFEQQRLRFVNSDHRLERLAPHDSHLIQLADLVLGATRQCLDGASGKPERVAVAQVLLPLLERLMDPKRRRNPNSRYSYVRRCSVSFFPSRSLSVADLEDESERARSGFYSCRPLLLKPGGFQDTLFPL